MFVDAHIAVHAKLPKACETFYPVQLLDEYLIIFCGILWVHLFVHVIKQWVERS